MAGKVGDRAKPKAETFPRKTIPCEWGPSDEEKARAYASLINSPELAAHRIVSMMQPKNVADAIDAPGMLETLRDQSAAVQRGDMAHTEAMLINQASSLQALFVRLTERAMEQTQMSNIEGFMRLALRSQSQCRATLETLAAIKNPPVIYARQANVTTGPQQINNGTRAREIESEQTKLSGATYELRENTGTQGIASGVNPALETVEKKHGAKVG